MAYGFGSQRLVGSRVIQLLSTARVRIEPEAGYITVWPQLSGALLNLFGRYVTWQLGVRLPQMK
jgi:hypothetical protein